VLVLVFEVADLVEPESLELLESPELLELLESPGLLVSPELPDDDSDLVEPDFSP